MKSGSLICRGKPSLGNQPIRIIGLSNSAKEKE
jgi:hypothetical protein